MKVLNYGSLNYDYTYQVSHLVFPGETLSSGDLHSHCGGKGLNQSIALAKAGAKVYHAGMVGEDGDELIAICRENGIDTRYIRRCPGKSGHAIIQVTPQGENGILLYGGANRKNSVEQIREVLDEFTKGDILLLQNEINMLPELIDTAYEKEMIIALNPSPFNTVMDSCDLKKVSIFLINEIEGKQMSGKENQEEIAETLIQMYPGSEIVLTLGGNGVLYRNAKVEVCMPAFRAKAIDTTAAGDTFTGYYLAGILDGMHVGQALRRAGAAASLAVTRPGASASIPLTEEVEEFLESMGQPMLHRDMLMVKE